MRAPQLLLVSFLALPTAMSAHPGGHPDGPGPDPGSGFDGEYSGDEGIQSLPKQIDVFDLVAFSRAHHRALRKDLLGADSEHSIVGMSDALALAAAQAGSRSARAVGRLCFRMSKASSEKDRAALLAQEAETLAAQQAQILAASGGAEPTTRAARNKLAANRSMLAFVTAWQTDPMDGLN